MPRRSPAKSLSDVGDDGEGEGQGRGSGVGVGPVGGASPQPDLVSVADELYGLPTSEFTARRNAAAKASKAGGDARLAAAVTSLAKPSAAAAAVNLLVRRRPEEFDALLGLAERLRVAQDDSDGPALAALGRERRALIAAAAGTAADLAAGVSGHALSGAVTADIEQTLQAALADANAAAAIRTGRLVRTLESSGLDETDLTDAVAGTYDREALTAVNVNAAHTATDATVEPSSSQSSHAGRGASERRLREAREASDRADTDAQVARATLDSVARKFADLKDARAASADEVEILAKRLAELRDAVDEADRRLAALERERVQADRASRSADRAARTARERLESAERETVPNAGPRRGRT